MTPEGRVKKNIDRILKSFPFVYPFKPVQFGTGAAGVDYHCVTRYGDLCLGFFIEAKKPGGEPTSRQDTFLRERRDNQRAMTFVVDDDPTINQGAGGIEELVKWLEQIEAYNEHYDKTKRNWEFVDTNI
jgi:hypothetical protein